MWKSKKAKESWLKSLTFTGNNVFKRTILTVFSSPFPAPLGYVSNFKVTSYTSTTVDVAWSPIVGATEYKLSWKTGDKFKNILPDLCLRTDFTLRLHVSPIKDFLFTMCSLNNVCIWLMLADGSKPHVQYLDRSVLFHRIEDLNPQSTYTVSICAVYGNSEGPEISLSQLTGTKHM